MTLPGNRDCGVNDGSGVKSIETRDSSLGITNLRGMPGSSVGQLHGENLDVGPRK